MFTFCLNLYFRVNCRHWPSPVSLTMAVISASARPSSDSGYGSLEELEEDFKPEIPESVEKRPHENSCSPPPPKANRILREENEPHEDIDKEEQESFKLYLKRVQECLAGRSRDDSMERLDSIIISVYKFRAKSYYLLQIVCCGLRPVNWNSSSKSIFHLRVCGNTFKSETFLQWWGGDWWGWRGKVPEGREERPWRGDDPWDGDHLPSDDSWQLDTSNCIHSFQLLLLWQRIRLDTFYHPSLL